MALAVAVRPASNEPLEKQLHGGRVRQPAPRTDGKNNERPENEQGEERAGQKRCEPAQDQGAMKSAVGDRCEQVADHPLSLVAVRAVEQTPGDEDRARSFPPAPALTASPSISKTRDWDTPPAMAISHTMFSSWRSSRSAGFCSSRARSAVDGSTDVTRNPTGLASALRIWQRLPPRSAASGGLNCIRRSNQRII